MKLETILEAFARPTVLNQLSELTASMGSALRVAGERATQMGKDGLPEKAIKMQFGSSLSRWFNAYYLREVEPALRNLGTPEAKTVLDSIVIHGNNTTRAENRTASNNFWILASEMINELRGLGPSLDNALANLRASYKTAKSQLDAAVQASRVNSDESDETILRRKEQELNKDYKQTIGKQMNQADQMAQQIINSLPDNIRADVRRAIARSDNKLQALMSELHRRGINPQ